MDNMFGLFRYRWLLQELVIRDLKIKYRKSVLGYVWSILNPLMMMAIMTIVFSQIFRFDIPNYPAYIITGQLLFMFFSEATSMGMQSILSSASLIRKVHLPKYIFPVSRVVSSFTTMFFSLTALIIVIVATGSSWHITAILVPVLMIYIFLFTLGVSLVLAVLLVYFRDTQYLYSVLLTALNYLTPIFYPVSILPDWVKQIIVFNPLYNFIEFFRKIMLYGQWPTLADHLICCACTFASLVIGIWVFRNKQKNFILYI